MSTLPRTQILNSSTFKAPPLGDKSLCLPDFYDWQYRNSPSHPFFVYDDGPGKIRTITWAEAVRGIHRAAHLVASRVSPGDAAAALEGRPVVVASLAAAGTPCSSQCRVHPTVDFHNRHCDICHHRSRNSASWVCGIPHIAEKLTRSHRPSSEKDGGKSLTSRWRAHASEACRGFLGITAIRWPSRDTCFPHASFRRSLSARWPRR
jgi:hypothetical protein